MLQTKSLAPRWDHGIELAVAASRRNGKLTLHTKVVASPATALALLLGPLEPCARQRMHQPCTATLLSTPPATGKWTTPFRIAPSRHT